MPVWQDIVVVYTVEEVTAVPVKTWDVGAIVGISDYAQKNKPVFYRGILGVVEDHGDDSPVTNAARAYFAQGAKRLYVVSVDAADPANPTAEEFETALNSLLNLAINRVVHGVCLAGITADMKDANDERYATKLQQFADAADCIFTVTNNPNQTVDQIIADATELKSPRGLFLAHADKTVESDIAAAALGVIMKYRPWHTLSYKRVDVPVNEYFSYDDVYNLESNNIAALTVGPNGENIISKGLTLMGNPKFLDITRTRMYAETLLDDRVTSLRLRATKIPYTEHGLAMIKTSIQSACDQMVREEAVARYEVAIPDINEIPPEWKAERILDDIMVTLWLTGDIELFRIYLTLTV